MKKNLFYLFFFIITLISLPYSGEKNLDDISPIIAPFDMPQLRRPIFPHLNITITKTGAKQNKLSTEAIQKAIDLIFRRGGGTVIIPEGKWLSGRIELKSNINLRLEEGAELHFSGDIKDYLPVVPTRNEGVDVISLGAMIYANGAENIGLTGSGKLIGPDRQCELFQQRMEGIQEEVQKVPFEQRIFDGSNGGEVCLPQFFGPINCKNILVEGVKFIDSIFWNIVPVYCENIIIRNVEVNSYGYGRTDGIDIDSSKNALIEHVTLDCGDDAFTLKAGRGMDGKLKGIPTENVVIRNCTVKRSVGGVTVGSETAAMIRNVYMHDCIMENPNSGFYFKSRRPRGGGGENMWFERIHIIDTPGSAFKWDMLGSSTYVGEMAKRHPAPPVTELTPVFRQMYFKDIIVDNCKTLIKAEGLPESPIEDITLENLQSKNHEIILQDVGKMSFK